MQAIISGFNALLDYILNTVHTVAEAFRFIGRSVSYLLLFTGEVGSPGGGINSFLPLFLSSFVVLILGVAIINILKQIL